MHILTVGAGINWLCAAWALAHTGHRVSVFDCKAIPYQNGTFYGQHRLIRTPYGSQRGFTLARGLTLETCGTRPAMSAFTATAAVAETAGMARGQNG